MKKTLLIINLFLFIGINAGMNAQAAPIVYLDFDNDGLQDTTTNVNTGNSLTASLYITGIDNSFGGLLSWGVQTQFDNTLLSASSYQIEPQWFEGVNNQIDNTTGTVDLLASAFVGSIGTLKLADIIFDTSIDGLAFINLDNINPELPNFVGFAGANGHNYDPEITFVNATVNIAAVPIPSALLLFLSGLVGLVGFNRKK